MKRTFMKAAVKTFTVFLAVAILAVGAGIPRSAQAALPKPNWMPGMPMMAGEQLILMWGVVPGAVQYKVYQNGKEITSVAGIQHIIPAPQEAGNYIYTITAVDAAGAESPASDERTIQITKLEPPKEISTLEMEDRVAVRWSSSQGAVIYDLYRKKKDEGTFQIISSQQGTNYQDPTLEEGIVYEYAVKSKDATGKVSDFSPVTEIMLEAKIVESAEGGAKGFKLVPLPTEFIGRKEVQNFTSDLVFIDNNLFVATGTIIWFPNLKPDTFMDEFEEVLLEGEKGFKGLGVDQDGNLLATRRNQIYVIDWAANRILKKYTVPNPEPGELVIEFRNAPRTISGSPILVDVAVDSEGTIYASDNRNQRVVKLSPEGEYLGTMSWEPDLPLAEVPDWRVNGASFISIDDRDRKFANGGSSIYLRDADDSPLQKIGGLGVVVGSFGQASGTTFDSEGRLWAADSKNGTLQIFEQNPDNGEFEPVYVAVKKDLMGNPPINTPGGIAWGPGPKGPRLYVAESLSRSVAVLEILWDQAQ